MDQRIGTAVDLCFGELYDLVQDLVMFHGGIFQANGLMVAVLDVAAAAANGRVAIVAVEPQPLTFISVNNNESCLLLQTLENDNIRVTFCNNYSFLRAVTYHLSFLVCFPFSIFSKVSQIFKSAYFRDFLLGGLNWTWNDLKTKFLMQQLKPSPLPPPSLPLLPEWFELITTNENDQN